MSGFWSAHLSSAARASLLRPSLPSTFANCIQPSENLGCSLVYSSANGSARSQSSAHVYATDLWNSQ
jgi:hypothetical protein